MCQKQCQKLLQKKKVIYLNNAAFTTQDVFTADQLWRQDSLNFNISHPQRKLSILYYIRKKIDAEPVVYTTVKELSYIQRIVLRNSVVSQVKLQAIRCLTLTLDNNCTYEKKLNTDLV